MLSYGLTETIKDDEAGTRGSLVYGSNEELPQPPLVQMRLRFVSSFFSLGDWLWLSVVGGNVLCRHAESCAGWFQMCMRPVVLIRKMSSVRGRGCGIGATGAAVGRDVLLPEIRHQEGYWVLRRYGKISNQANQV